MAAAETGSGKTAAFCLPMIQCVYERLRDLSHKEDSVPAKRRAVEITLNSEDKDLQLDINNNGLGCSCSSGGIWAGARATHGVKGGKHYYEVEVKGTGICRVGWSSMAAHLELGKDSHGFGYGGKGFISTNGSFDNYGGHCTVNDVVGCFIDFNEKTISYSKNGNFLGKAFDMPEHIVGAVLFPAVLVQNSSLLVNFGTTPFVYPPKHGYSGLAQANNSHIFDSNSKEAYFVAGKRKPMAIIIEPTKDLAEQVAQCVDDFTKYITDPELSCVLLIGDDSKAKVEQKLRKGVDIVIGTIGKIAGMIKSGLLDLSQIRFFILDEADRLATPDNLASVMQIYAKCPGGGGGENRLQVLFQQLFLPVASIC